MCNTNILCCILSDAVEIILFSMIEGYINAVSNAIRRPAKNFPWLGGDAKC